MQTGPHDGRARGFGQPLHLLLAVFLLFNCSCNRGSSTADRASRVLPAVEAVQARFGALPLSQRLSGLVKAKNQVEVYPQIDDVITAVLAENGDAVKKGQPLILLEDTDYQKRLKQAQASQQITVAQLRRAQAQLKEARADLERFRSLAEKGLASDAELESAETRAESAEADLELAKARVDQALATTEEQEDELTQTVIRAPITGHVGNRNAEVGMLVNPNTRLFTVGQLDSIRVEVVLTDRMLSYIKEGQRSEVSTPDGTSSAPLSRISPFLNPVSHATEAEIDMGNPKGDLKPGMFVTVDVYYGESEQATLVPLSALYEHPATGAVGVYITRAPLDREPVAELDASPPAALTEPVSFEFVPTEVIAQGRLEAAILGVEPDTWVVTLGQNLLGGENGEARVRLVQWERVEHLQRLQREDLMESLIEKQTTP